MKPHNGILHSSSVLRTACLHLHSFCIMLKFLTGSNTGCLSRKCLSLCSFWCMGQICSAFFSSYFGHYINQIYVIYGLYPKTLWESCQTTNSPYLSNGQIFIRPGKAQSTFLSIRYLFVRYLFLNDDVFLLLKDCVNASYEP